MKREVYDAPGMSAPVDPEAERWSFGFSVLSK
jgi:hypothetical protein